MKFPRSPFLRRAAAAGAALLLAAAPAAALAGAAPLKAPAPVARAVAQAAPAAAEVPAPVARRSAGAAVLAAPRAGAGAEAIAARTRLSGRVGFALIDVETGARLETLRGDEGFPPASVAKLVTALYALETLGPDHRFETRLVASAPVGPDGVLKGALALVGGGDPDLDTDDLAELAAQARGRGLARVDGDLVIDASAAPAIAAIDHEQPEDAAYNPSVSALNLNYNRVLFGWTRGKDGALSLSMQAPGRQWRPESGVIDIAAAETPRAVLARRDTEAREGWEVMVSALNKEGQRWLPVRRPEIYAGDAFRAVAAAQGLALPAPSLGAAPREGAVLAFRRSGPLIETVRDMLRWSTNLTAEAVGLAATRAQGRPAADLEASGAAMSAWAAARAGLPGARAAAAPRSSLVAKALAATGAGPSGGLDLRNHSGLSAASESSPAQMAGILRAAAHGPQGAFGRGAPGLLEGVLREVPLQAGKGEAKLPKGVSAVAKTGTLNFVRGLAGYVTAASGRKLAFAIFSEDLERRALLTDGNPGQGSRGWLGRARAMEREMVRDWAARY